MNPEIQRLISEGNERDALFALECLVADRHGEFPEGWEDRLPDAILERSPLLMQAYARCLADDGNLGEAKRLLEQGLKGFTRQAVTADLLSASALYAITNLRLGNTEEALTAVRFLHDECSGSDEECAKNPDVLFALARGGYLIGMDKRQRLRRYESAATLYMEQDRVNRSFEALFERMRLSMAAGSDEDSPSIVELIAQRAKWHPRYAPHASLISQLERMQSAQHAVSFERETSDECPGIFYKLLLSLLTLRAAIRFGYENENAERTMEKIKEQIETAFKADLELQAELHLTEFELMVRQKNREHAEAALKRAASLITVGLPPEYAETFSRCREALQRMSAETSALPAPVSVATPETPWLVRCFGGLTLERKGAETKTLRWKRKKAQELFLFLLLRPGYSVPKEQAMDVLFGDADPDKITNQLYVTVHEIKRVLQAQLGWAEGLGIRDGVIRLPERHIDEVDVEKYTALVRVADQLQANDPELSLELYEKAFELYQPLLPDIQYIDWLDRARDELERKQLHILQQLYKLFLRNGNLERAEAYCREWCALSPLDEEAHQALFRLLIKADRAAEAKRLYYAFEKLLLKELKAAPLEETKRMCFRL